MNRKILNNKSFEKKLWFISGLMMIFIGIACFFAYKSSTENTAKFIGFAVLVTAFVNVIYLIYMGDVLPGLGYVMYDAVVNFALAAYLLSSDKWHVLITLLPYVFAITIVAKGVEAILDANQSRIVLDRYWYVNLVLGIIIIIFGIVCFVEPMIGHWSIKIIGGLVLILSGVTTIRLWTFEHRYRKKIRGWINKYGGDFERFRKENPEEYLNLEAMIDV